MLLDLLLLAFHISQFLVNTCAFACFIFMKIADLKLCAILLSYNTSFDHYIALIAARPLRRGGFCFPGPLSFALL